MRSEVKHLVRNELGPVDLLQGLNHAVQQVRTMLALDPSWCIDPNEGLGVISLGLPVPLMMTLPHQG